MKRLAIVFAVLFVFSISANAQMEEGMKPEQKGQMGPGMMGGEGKMPMMPMCQEMMKHHMGEGQQMMPMMQMMMNMMQMQKKMMRGMKPAEKKEMMMEMDRMMEKMNKMMSMRMGMMGGMGMMGKGMKANVKCAEEWLKKAIDLHEVHIKDPKTATEASQMEMMDQMKKAYECLTATGSEMSPAPSKKPEGGEKKKDEHGH